MRGGAHPAGWLLALVLAVAAALRLYGLEWDGGQWLHPDERQVYFVALGLDWPRSLAEALTPGSPLNPGFFAYGSLPIYLLRLVQGALALLWPAARDGDNLHLVGRALAALLDLGSIALTYRLARRLWPGADGHALPAGPGQRRGAAGEAEVQAASSAAPASHPPAGPRAPGENEKPGQSKRGDPSPGAAIGLLAAALLAVAGLHVQLAHFYTPEPLLACLAMLALNAAEAAARRPRAGRWAALGAVLGLALATKASAAPIGLVGLAAVYRARQPGAAGIGRDIARLMLVLGAAGLAWAAAQPYAIVDWPTYLADTAREARIAWGALHVPYTVQFADSPRLVYPAWQLALWGLGLPLGVAVWAGLGAATVRWLRHGAWPETILLAWAGPGLAVAAVLYAKYPRYLLPMVPVLCLLAAHWLAGPVRPAWRRAARAAAVLVLLASLVYALVLAALYAAPHSWITASEWLYRQVPAGSTLAVEAWDTALPLPLKMDGRPRRIDEYVVRTLEVYDTPDDESKWARLAATLAEADYVVIASRRAYGSIGRQPQRYPWAAGYYAQLLNGGLGFEPAAEFVRPPAWLNPRASPLTGGPPPWLLPDESLVVYDRPRALVLRNAGRLSAEEIVRRIAP